MIKTSKRMLSLLIVLALVLAIAPMAIFAADEDVTVYVQPNSNWLQDNARFAVYYFDDVGGTGWVDATDPDGDGVYEAVIPAGYPSIIFCRMNPATTENSWSNKWNQTANLTVPTDDNNCYVVVGWDNGAGQWTTVGGEVEPIPMAYYIVGSMNGWTAAESNKMTAVDELTYTIDMDLAAGNYEYKVTTSDGQWSADPNMTLTVNSDCSATFTLTLAEKDSLNGISVTATGAGIGGGEVEPPVPEVNYYVAGDESLTGYPWQADGAIMTANEDGTYSVTFTNVAAGKYQFKVTNGTWDTSWGAATTSGNVEITVETAGDVTITFDPATGSITYTGAVETKPEPIAIDYLNVVGNGSGNWLNGEEWNLESYDNTMESQNWATQDIFTKTYYGVAAGEYQFKFAANGSWDYSWATGNLMESGTEYELYYKPLGNSSIVVAEDNSTIKLVVDTTNMDLLTGAGAKVTVTVEAGATVEIPETVVLGDNTYTVIDATPGAGTFTATEDGILVINPTAIVEATMGEVPGPWVATQFGRGNFSIVVNGQEYLNQASVSLEVKAGQTYEIGIVNNMDTTATVTLNLSMEAYDIKWQVDADSADAASTNLRLITYADSLDYKSVILAVTVNGKTVEYKCTTVYSNINADGVSISNAAEVFGNDAQYFVTHSMLNVPAAAFNTEIEVTVYWENMDGTYVYGNTRTIVIADNWA